MLKYSWEKIDNELLSKGNSTWMEYHFIQRLLQITDTFK